MNNFDIITDKVLACKISRFDISHSVLQIDVYSLTYESLYFSIDFVDTLYFSGSPRWVGSNFQELESDALIDLSRQNSLCLARQEEFFIMRYHLFSVVETQRVPPTTITIVSAGAFVRVET